MGRLSGGHQLFGARLASASVDRYQSIADGSINLGEGSATTCKDCSALAPRRAITASVGSTYQRIDDGKGTCLYVKESGTGSNGWVAK